MRQEHRIDGKNYLLTRTYLGNGRYFQRGICKGIEAGDDFFSFTEPKRTLKVDKIQKREDAKGVFINEGDRVMSYYEAELIDESYSNIEYIPLSSFGRIKAIN